MSTSLRLHRFAKSGHSHRAEVFISLIGVKHDLIDVDLANGEHKKPPFLAMNPAGQIPVLEDCDTIISDSNAILVYLARKFAPDWLPTDPVQEAQVQRFLTMAAGEIAYGPAAARLITVFGAPLDAERCQAIATGAFQKLEAHLNGREWLVGTRPSIADIAIYSYTAHAPEGNVSLDEYPNIRAFLARIEALPGFVAMPKTEAGLRA